MSGFVLRRLASMLLVLLAVSVLVFAIFNLIPGGDPAQRMAGRGAGEVQVEAVRREWGFDRPVHVQYLTTMRKLLTGDTVSYFTRQNVVGEIWRGLPRTLSLAIGAALIWMAFGVALGVYTAIRAGAAADRLLTVLALVGISMPVFWLGALLSHYLGFKLGLFPSGGYVGLLDDPLAWLHHMILPWTALSVLFIGLYSRVVRAGVLEALGEDHVRTARAKGLPERTVLRRHVLRTALVPVTALWGLDFAAVIGGGAILTETVFDLQGVGQYAADAIGQLDQPPILAVTMFGACFVVLLNAVVDIAQAALDPRVRLKEERRA